MLSARGQVANILIFSSLIIVFCLRANEAKISESLKVHLPHGGGIIGRYLTSSRGRGIRAFMGIPYAEPPVASLRFRDPIPKKPWSGDRETVSNEVMCPQVNIFNVSEAIKEDCLYLDVYVPQFPATEKLLPVMVFFHGGGWHVGSASFYEPDFFLDHDVILVIGNYRLGALGFLTTNTTDSTGNFGLKDMVEILNWVQKNIKAFGGNKDQVTIFGESAGAASVTYLMQFSGTTGLFHRAIAQSGNYFDPWTFLDTARALDRTQKYATALACPLGKENKWNELVECLRGKSIDDLVKAEDVLTAWLSSPIVKFPPTLEYDRIGGLIPDDPKNIAENPSAKIPLLIGINHDEGGILTAGIVEVPKFADELEKKWNELLPVLLEYDHLEKSKQNEITDAATDFYTGRSQIGKIENFTNLIGDFIHFNGLNKFLQNRFNSETVAETYVYLFAHRGDATFKDVFYGPSNIDYGVCHSDDLLYLFPLLQKSLFKSTPSREDIFIQETLVKLWVNFATYGEPTPVGSLDFEWKPTSKFPIDYLRIGNTKNPNNKIIGMENNLWPERAEFLRNL